MLSFAQSVLLSIATWLPVMTVIITIHELGHFLVARGFGVAVDRFSIGFGKPIFSRRDRYGTEWRISWLPVGGYVRFAGDDNDSSVPDSNDLEDLRASIVAREGVGAEMKYFAFKPLWQRACVVAAGPVANFVLAIVLFAGIFGVFGEYVAYPKVGSVEPGSAAAHAGIAPGDTILAIDGHPISSFDQLGNYIALRSGVPIQLTIQRGAGRFLATATPVEREVDSPIAGKQKIGRLGLGSAVGAGAGHWVRYGPIEAVGAGAARTLDILQTTTYYIGRMVRGQVSGDQISGPIGTAQAAGAVARVSAQDAPNLPMAILAVTVNLISMAAFFSVAIGFLNLLPIPVLDGGHLLFYAYEAAARRPLAASVQMVTYRVGLALVLGLMLFATTNDLRRNNVFHFLGGLFS
jgi:regulator of sigma E protease